MLGHHARHDVAWELQFVSVKVVRERSDQRRHHRVTAPLFVVLDGHKLKATDWSLGGLRLDDFPGTLPGLGTTVKLNLSIPFQGFDVAFDCEAEVVRRIEASRTLAFKYTRISDRELGLMEHFIDELIRGSMVDVKDTIQRIDVPVTPASTNPDPNPLAKIPISRWPTKTIAFVALYLTIGLFVFGYAGVIAYTNFVRMEVDSAVIASPIESVRAQVNGRIVYGKYRQGDHVPKGALLLSMVDNDLERQIDLASIDIKDKAAQLSASDRQLQEEIARVDAFAKVEGKNLDQIELEVQSLEAQAKAAQALHQRMDHLFKQGFTTATIVESAEKQMISSKALAESKRLELQTRRTLATDNAGSRLYNGQSFSGDRVKVEAQNFLARENVATAEKKLQALLDHRDRLAVYAPYAGMLQELPRADNSMVRVGDTIAVVENPKAREIWAFLRQDEVLSVGLDDEVKVYLPGLSELRKARVMRIDRTIGFVNEMNSTYIWRAPRDRSAKVIMEFIDVGARPEDENYRTGMPAVAIFSTRPTNYLIGDMAHRFRMVFGGRARKPPEDKLASRARKEAPVEDTPGTADKDRLGPPRNYVSSGNATRDPDAVTARRTELALAPRRLPDQPAASAVKPAAIEPPPAGVMERFAEGFANLRRQLFGLSPQGEEPVARKQHAVAEPAVPAPKAPSQRKPPVQAPRVDAPVASGPPLGTAPGRDPAPSAPAPSAQTGNADPRTAAVKPNRVTPSPAPRTAKPGPMPPPADEADDDADEPAPRSVPQQATTAGLLSARPREGEPVEGPLPERMHRRGPTQARRRVAERVGRRDVCGRSERIPAGVDAPIHERRTVSGAACRIEGVVVLVRIL